MSIFISFYGPIIPGHWWVEIKVLDIIMAGEHLSTTVAGI